MIPQPYEDGKPVPEPPQTKIEMVGGPMCGDRVRWPSREHRAGFAFGRTIAVYQYEGYGKAVHIGWGRLTQDGELVTA